MSRLAHPRTLIAILVLPLLVVGLGMWALSGRVDRLDTVPAAVVNLDAGAEITDADGNVQTVPFGRLLAGALTQPGTLEDQDSPAMTGFDWRLTTEEDAEQGLRDGSYSAVIVIPETFSERLATLGTPEAAQAILEVTTNDASGQINALVGSAVAEASASTMGGQMAEQYLDGLYLGFNSLGEGFTDAADGAGELAEGTTDLDSGVQDLAQGTRDLADGTGEAADGAREFSDGVWTFTDGTWQLADGSRTLADGLDELATGTEDLDEGVVALQQGMRGTEAQPGLVDGAEQLAAGVEGDGTAANPGIAGGADQLATGLEQFSSGVGQTGAALSGDGTAQNPGLTATAQGVATGATEIGEGVQGLADGLDGTPEQPGLVQGAEGVTAYSEALGTIVNGDGSQENPGLAPLAGAMESSACTLAERYPDDLEAQALCQQATGVVGYAEGARTVVDGDGTPQNPGLTIAAQGVGTGAAATAEGAQQLADGLRGTDQQPGLVQGAEGVVAYSQGLETAFTGDGAAENPGLTASAEQLATGARASADGAGQLVEGVTGLRDGLVLYADGVDELAEGTGLLAEGARASADGAGGLADGTGELALGADQLGTGAEQLAEGTEQLAQGTGDLADGTDTLAEGTTALAEGTNELAEGLREGADSVPSYSEEERARMGQMAAAPVGTEVQRQNEADGAGTATFPFVAGLALWLGAFGTFLLLPALRRRLLDRALPMTQVVLRSLAPALVIAAVQAVAVLALLTALGVSPISPLGVGLVALAGAGMFAALHQALLTVLGARIGRITSVLLMVLQVVTLVGIVPVETAPELLQSLSSLMPLAIVTQGLVHASLGGSLVSTSSTLLAILAWAAVSLVLTLVASRRARLVGSSEHVGARPLPAMA